MRTPHIHEHHRGPWSHHPGEPGDHGDGPEGREDRGERRGRGRGRRGGPGGPGPWGAWGAGGPGGPGGPGGHHGPPPWVAGLFGADLSGRSEQRGPGGRRGGPRVRRGDVRHAILDVLREAADVEAGSEQDVNGYQVIQRIAERSGGVWKPSPGSVYPTVQQLQDEGLVTVDEQRRRALGLTDEGRAYVEAHAAELVAVWAPFEAGAAEDDSRPGDLRPQIGQMMAAVWQVASAGSPAQREAAAEVLTETRRRLYGILADGDDSAEAGDS